MSLSLSSRNTTFSSFNSDTIHIIYLQSLKHPHEYNRMIPVWDPHTTFLPFWSPQPKNVSISHVNILEVHSTPLFGPKDRIRACWICIFIKKKNLHIFSQIIKVKIEITKMLFRKYLKSSYKSIRIHCKFMDFEFDTFIKTTDSNSSSENSDRVCTFQ